MPRSSIRRRIETGISNLIDALKAELNQKRLKVLISEHSPEPAKPVPVDSLAAPQSLNPMNLTVGVHSECEKLTAPLGHMFDRLQIIPSLSAEETTKDKIKNLDLIILLMLPGYEENDLRTAIESSRGFGVSVAAFVYDSTCGAFRPVSSSTCAQNIALGIIPSIDNPISNSPRGKGTLIFSDNGNWNSEHLSVPTTADIPIRRTKCRQPIEAKTAEKQIVLSPSHASLPRLDLLVNQHLATGIPLSLSYSPYIFNKFPIIDSISKYKKPGKQTKLNRSWHGFLASSLVSTAFDNGTIYDSLSSMVEPSIKSIEPHKLWKDRVLVVCDNATDELQKILKSQYHVEACLMTSIEVNSLPHERLVNDFDYITRMTSDFKYPPNYLHTKLCIFKYTSVDFVTEPNSPTANTYTPTSLANNPYCTVSNTKTYGAREFSLRNSESITGNGFIDSGFGVTFFTNLQRELVANDTEYELSVVVPVFNNGDFLVSKALPSLMNNACWQRMQVILVDDGSTDRKTVEIQQFLASIFPNIQTYAFPMGGSGSASRPRNKGISIASCSAITFLDPDNEISAQGYDKLLSRFQQANQNAQQCDFVSGYQVKLAARPSVNAQHSFSPWPTLIKNPRKEFFESGMFPTVSTQAAIISRQFLVTNAISFVDGAIGQDTLFGWEVLLASRNPTFTREAFLIYYSERSSSVTNLVNAKFFEKSYRREIAQVDWLARNHILRPYLARKYDVFLNVWYKDKLKYVPEDDLAVSKAYLRRIAQLYGKDFQ